MMKCCVLFQLFVVFKSDIGFHFFFVQQNDLCLFNDFIANRLNVYNIEAGFSATIRIQSKAKMCCLIKFKEQYSETNINTESGVA